MLKLERGCTLATPKCDWKRWNLGDCNSEPRQHEMKPCCIKHLREIIWYLSDLFHDNRITYWMDFGTLLGAVREGRSIPHDTDGDFCLYEVDRERVVKLKRQMYLDGFWMGPTTIPTKQTLSHANVQWRDGHIKIYRSRMNCMCVDLFFWKVDHRRGVLTSGGLNTPKTFPVWWVEKLAPIPIFDKMVMAPREPTKFLRMRFGQDWRVPQNKKVHFENALETHKFGFEYAAKNGWRRPGTPPPKPKTNNKITLT